MVASFIHFRTKNYFTFHLAKSENQFKSIRFTELMKGNI